MNTLTIPTDQLSKFLKPEEFDSSLFEDASPEALEKHAELLNARAEVDRHVLLLAQTMRAHHLQQAALCSAAAIVKRATGAGKIAQG